jgi:hypothetical protein
MTRSVLFKEVVLSIFYFIVAIILMLLLDIGVYYLVAYVIIDVFNWFNGIWWFWKVTFIIIGGTSLFIALLNLVSKLSTLVGGVIFNKMPQNYFTQFSTFLLALANAIYNIVWIWRIPPHYNFWIVCEMLLLSVFMWSLMAIVLPLKEQMQANNENRY